MSEPQRPHKLGGGLKNWYLVLRDNEPEEDQTKSQIDIYLREARVGQNMDIIQ